MYASPVRGTEQTYLAREAKARNEIDKQLMRQAGSSRAATERRNAGRGVAIREFVSGQAPRRVDYLLFVNGSPLA